MSSDAHKWFSSWLPAAREAGPFVTVLLGALLIITTWWLVGKIDDCVERNRALADRMVAKQDAMHTEIMMRLAHCPPPR